MSFASVRVCTRAPVCAVFTVQSMAAIMLFFARRYRGGVARYERGGGGQDTGGALNPSTVFEKRINIFIHTMYDVYIVLNTLNA